MAVREPSSEVVINLDGPAGNAFALMGNMRTFARQLKWPAEKIDSVLDEMMSGDYVNLVKVFDREFGAYVTLETSQDYLLEALADEN